MNTEYLTQIVRNQLLISLPGGAPWESCLMTCGGPETPFVPKLALSQICESAWHNNAALVIEDIHVRINYFKWALRVQPRPPPPPPLNRQGGPFFPAVKNDF